MNFDGNPQFGKIQSANVHDRDTTLPVITNFDSNTEMIPTKRKSREEKALRRKKEGDENCLKTMLSKTYSIFLG